MRLRNKKTGVIGVVGYISTSTGDILVSNIHDQEEWYHYKSLAALNEEWCDAENDDGSLTKEWEDAPEEPKEYWYIAHNGIVGCFEREDDWQYMDFNWQDKLKEIGNYFNTREEAEKAVEKLKAWKRLKDKGFRFTLTPGVGSLDIAPGKFQIEINAEMPEKWFCCDAVQKDLVDCFGGEE